MMTNQNEIEEDQLMVTVGDYEYRTGDRLGEGGYGTVYRGQRLTTGQQVALKRMPTDQVKQTELDSVLKVQSTFVVTILEILTTATMDNSTYMIMELCDIDLDQYMKTYGKLNAQNLDTVAKCLAQGYLTLHINQVVHRDIKPHNILLNLKNSRCSQHCRNDNDRDNNNDQPLIEVAKFADFGLSRSQSSTNDRLTNLAGTLFYMAPEVGANLVNAHQYDQGADMWSLGVVLYECACGSLPLTEQQLCKLFLRAMERNYCGYMTPSIPESVSEKYKHVVTRLLSLDPSSRLSPTEFHACVVHENLGSLLRCAQSGPCSSMNRLLRDTEGGSLKRTSSDLFARLLSLVK